MQLSAKILALYFLIGSFFPRTDFSQIVYLPDMMDHLQEHRQSALESGVAFSYFDFFLNHFVNPDSHQHPDNSHQNLPLNHSLTFLNLCLVYPVITPIEDLDSPGSEIPTFHQVWTINDFAKGLFRPPILH